MKIKNVGQLKNLIKDLDDNLPIGVYHENWWTPEFDGGATLRIIKKNGKLIGLATEIDYSHDY